MSIAEARKNFSDLVARAHYRGERIEIRRRDTPIAAIISAEEAQLMEQLLVEFGCASMKELVDVVKRSGVADKVRSARCAMI